MKSCGLINYSKRSLEIFKRRNIDHQVVGREFTIEKTIDLSKSVHDLCVLFPEIKGIMEELGFKDITKPGMLNTAGRFMTLPKGGPH